MSLATGEAPVLDSGTRSISPLYKWGLFCLLSLIWGSSFLLIKTGLGAFTPLQVGTMRIAVAFIAVLPLSIYMLRRSPKKLLLSYFFSGLMGNLLPSILFSVAGNHIPSSISGCLNAFTPIFTMLLGIVLYQQRLATWQVLGLIAGFGGAVLLSSTKGQFSLASINPFAGLIMLATIFYSINVNFIKFRLAESPPLQNGIMALTFAGLPAFLWLCFDQDFITRLVKAGPTNQSVISIVILGLLGSAAGTLLFNRMIKSTTTIFASSVTYVIPFVAVILGLFFGEPFGFLQVSGLLMIVFGVYLVNRR
jgi:drug/metabolite transporter (DMT)-like permease